jgi:hypothetical protein
LQYCKKIIIAIGICPKGQYGVRMATKVPFLGKRELRWFMVGQCLVTYMEEEVEFADALWDEWMEVIRHPNTTSIMLCSWGPTQPSHQQWRRVTRLMRERELPVAVVTEARHNLALAKAASWLGTNIESHRWGDLATAVRSLGLGDQAITAQARIVALRDRFGAKTPSAEVFHGAESSTTTKASTESTDALDVTGMPASSAVVFRHNDEIQKRLAQVQARFRSHTATITPPTPGSRD